MEAKKITKGYIMVGLCGVLWGSALLYTQYLLDSGIRSKDIVSWKMLFGFITMFLYICFKDRNLLKIDKKGLAYTAFMGLVCHTLFNLFIFISMERTTIATTVALMYTSPIFVMIISRFFLQEKFTANKICALILCTLGVFLTVTGGKIGELSFDILGVLFGLSAGLFYAIMNLLNKRLLDKYSELTMLAYTLGFAFIFSLSFSNPLMVFELEFDILIWLYLFMLGVVATALGYLLFITGLSNGVESSKAAIIVTLEVPVSVIGSYIFFSQAIGGWKSIGIILVLISVVVLQENIFKSFVKREHDVECE